MKKFVITIGREFGSGGRAVAKLLAEKLGVKCYDEELVEMASSSSGLHPEMVASLDEKALSPFSFAGGGQFYLSSHGAHNVQIQAAFSQFNAIKELAKNENCVIVGRVADYVLKDNPNTISIFVSADLDYRIQRIMEYEGVSEKKAEKIIIKNDRNRAKYYNFFSNKKWGEAKTYDLCVKTSLLGIEKSVDFIFDFINLTLKDKSE